MESELSGYAELFMRYDYAETKDLCKHFLTVVISVLVFSLAFSEKIVGFSSARSFPRALMIFAWCLMMVAIITCGIGLVFDALAGGEAVYGGKGFYSTAKTAYTWILVAGGCFILGLIALIGAAIASMRQSPNREA